MYCNAADSVLTAQGCLNVLYISEDLGIDHGQKDMPETTGSQEEGALTSENWLTN
jgi:hypothetical protein